jgi:hypothetical protein
LVDHFLYNKTPSLVQSSKNSQKNIILTNTLAFLSRQTMEQHTLKTVNNCLNTNIYSYIETSGGQDSNLYLNVVHFFNASVNKTSVAA